MKNPRCLTVRWPMRAIALAVAGSSVACATAPQGAAADLPSTWTARGNEPSWRLDHGDRWRLSMIELTLEGRAPPLRIEGERRIYEGRIEGRDLRVVLTDRLCRDTMTGMPHPWTAQLRLDGRALDGCGGEPRALLLGRWRVIAVDGLQWPAGEALLAFDADGRLGGSTGCNAINARWTLTGEGLSVQPGAATRKACPSPLDAAERSLLEVLHEAMRFDIADDRALLLHGVSGRSVRATRVRPPPEAPNAKRPAQGGPFAFGVP